MLLLGIGLSALWPQALAWALGLLAAEYLLSLYVRDVQLDLAAPIYGGLLLLLGELGHASLQARESATLRRRPAPTAIVLLGSAAAGYALILIAALPVAGSAALTALGALAAVAAVGLVAWGARRMLAS